MGQFRGARRVGASLAVIVGFGALAGCGQMSNPTYDVGTTGCAGAPEKTILAIQERLEAPGTLRNARVVKSPDSGTTFVSAELHLRSDEKHTSGEILTWSTDDVAGNEFFSVDVHAREESSWPHADVDVRAAGARESRACAGLNRGKTRAQVRCEQHAASGDVVLPAGTDCGDL